MYPKKELKFSRNTFPVFCAKTHAFITTASRCSILASYLRDPGFDFGVVRKQDILIHNYYTSPQVPLVICCDSTLKYLEHFSPPSISISDHNLRVIRIYTE